jgi:hypothetical protein
MQASGIDRDTTIEGFGHIHRFSNGEPTGLFTDCKVLPIMEPEYNEDQQLAAVSEFMKRMNAWGYTSIMSIAPIMLFEPERYMDLEKEDLLTLRINCAQMILPLEVDQCIHNLCRLREAFQHSDVRITTGKFLVDGVLEGKTALLKEPYAETAGMGPEYFGDINWGKEELKNAIRQVNKAGFQTHMHCIGDAATSQTVDAVEYSQKENNNDQLRNVITHLQIVDPDDIRRMSEEKIIAAIQPFWHFKEPGWFENIDTAMLGEKRAENQYPARSLVDAGIIITASGDYPVSPINDPFHGIQAGVTRNIYNDDYDVIIDDPDDKRFLLNAPERLSVAELIEAYTINGAYQLFREDEIGSLEQGKKADMIVIDQDILHCDLLRIHDTKVLATVFNGRVVHGLL